MTIWLNGAFRPSAFAIDANDRAFSIGDGIFETFLVRDGCAAFVAAHFARLRQGLDLFRIDSAIAPDDFARIVEEICNVDGISGDAAARLTISRGVGPRWTSADRGAPVTVVVSVDAIARAAAEAPLAIAVAPFRRHAGAATSRFKAIGGYGEHILARRWAAESGCDDAVMLNEFGRVACATTANIFAIAQNGNVSTPAISEGALPGIVRACLIDGAARHGVPISEGAIGVATLEKAVIILTSSVAGLRRARLLTNDAKPGEAALESLGQLEQWYHSAIVADLNDARRKLHAGVIT